MYIHVDFYINTPYCYYYVSVYYRKILCRNRCYRTLKYDQYNTPSNKSKRIVTNQDLFDVENDIN